MVPRVHVLFIIDSIGTPGGAEQSLAAIAPEYRRLGVQLDVAVLHDRPGHQVALREAGAELFVLRGDSRFARVRSATRLIKSRRPDLVHTTLFEADLVGRVAARAESVPVVSSLASDPYGVEHFANPLLSAWKLRAAWLLDASTARLAVRMHSVSRHVADTMAKRLRYPRDRIDVVPRGRDPAVLGTRTAERRVAARERLGVDADLPVLLAVARQEHPKGLDIAVRSLRAVREQFPDAVLMIAGRAGTQTPDLERLAEAEGVAAAAWFLGTRDDVAELLCAADLFVMPSRREGLPGALLEAMALEAPAVVSDLPQIAEVVDESMAWVVPVDDPGALAAAIVEVLQHPDEAAARAALARQRFLADFSIASVAERMLGFYEWALADKSKSRRART